MIQCTHKFTALLLIMPPRCGQRLDAGSMCLSDVTTKTEGEMRGRSGTWATVSGEKRCRAS